MTTISRKAHAGLLTLLLGLCGTVVGQDPGPAQRKIETYRPPSVTEPLPLKIVDVKNLQNDSFLRDMEIHLKNVSDKPIYYIRLGVHLPAVKEYSGGKDFGFFIRYGRPELSDLKQKPGDDDKPLMPNKTHVFKVPEAISLGFESYALNKKLPLSATLSVLFRIDTVNFGDGSGFINGGVPWKIKSVSGRRNIYRFDVSVQQHSLARKCPGNEQLAFLNVGYTPSRNERLAFLRVGYNPDDCDQNCAQWKHYNPNPEIYRCELIPGYTCPYEISEQDPAYPCSRIMTYWFCCGPGQCWDFNCYDDYSTEC